MKIGQEVFVVIAGRQRSGGYAWHVEHRRVVSFDAETVCATGTCGVPTGRLQFFPLARVYENVGIADAVREDYTVRGLTPQEVFGERG